MNLIKRRREHHSPLKPTQARRNPPGSLHIRRPSSRFLTPPKIAEAVGTVLPPLLALRSARFPRFAQSSPHKTPPFPYKEVVRHSLRSVLTPTLFLASLYARHAPFHRRGIEVATLPRCLFPRLAPLAWTAAGLPGRTPIGTGAPALGDSRTRAPTGCSPAPGADFKHRAPDERSPRRLQRTNDGVEPRPRNWSCIG